MGDVSNTNIFPAIEAILFAYGEPISCELLSEAAGIDTKTTDTAVKELNEHYDRSNSAFQILKLDDSYQMTTRKEYSAYVKKAFESGRNSALSSAAMESLAIVAYNQPVTKSFVEAVRGVDSSAVMNKLAERGLIEEAERLEIPGRPIAYKTTKNFLRCFSLSSLDDLPPLKLEESQQLSLFEQSEISNKTDGDEYNDLSGDHVSKLPEADKEETDKSLEKLTSDTLKTDGETKDDLSEMQESDA